MLSQMDSVYIKPVSLYKGQGVMRVNRKDGKFIIEFRGEEANESKVCRDLSSLLRELDQILLPNYEYVLQETIQLAQFLGNNFDVRVMLQKKDALTWEISALNARIAPIGSVITSPRSGGEVFRLRDALALYFPFREKEIIQKIKFLAVNIGYVMEDKYGYLGELGIDLGIDVNGKVWVIEVNGRPLKVSFNLMRDKTISKVIHKNPVMLGFSLTGFDILPKLRSLPPHLFSILYTFKPASQDWLLSTQAPSKKILFLSPSQKRDFKFRIGQKIILQIGFSSVEVEIAIQTWDSKVDTMFLSQEALKELPYYL